MGQAMDQAWGCLYWRGDDGSSCIHCTCPRLDVRDEPGRGLLRSLRVPAPKEGVVACKSESLHHGGSFYRRRCF